MAAMPSAKVLREDIEARSTWKVNLHRIELEDSSFTIPELERRVVDGPYRGKKVAVGLFPRTYFKSGVDYEAALARLLADAEDRFATLLESGDSGADDGNTNAAA